MEGLMVAVDAKATKALTGHQAGLVFVYNAIELAGLEFIGVQVHVFPDVWGSGPGTTM